jgi:hypothetical protein
MGPLPESQATYEEFARYFRDYHDRILAGASIQALGLVLTFCFLAGLWATLRERAGVGGPALPAVALIAGALRIAVVLLASAMLLAPAYRWGISDPGTPRTLADLYAVTIVLSAYPTIVSLAAFGVTVLQTRALPPWLGLLTLLASTAHLLAASTFLQSGPLAPSGFVGTRLMPAIYYGWVAAVSVALLLGPSSRSREP